MILNHNKLKYDCVINIDTGKITISNDINEKLMKSTKIEKTIYNTIYNKLKNNFDDKNENWMVNMNVYEPIFEGSDDFIRNEFKNYFYEFFINLSLALQISNNNMGDNVIHLNAIGDNNGESSDILETDSDGEEDVSNTGGEVSKKNKKEIEKFKNKAVKKVLYGYNIEFICNWLHTLNFKIWVSSHDKSLCLRSSFVKQANNITIYYDNGDVYSGSLSRGKKNGFGVLNEFSSAYVYNGFWEDDMKSGSGCMTSSDFKVIYDGEWKENKKNGQGQLIFHKIKYSGTFKNDLYHGTGILCDGDGNIYEGDFIKGLFNGMGHYKMNTSEMYIGQFRNNLFEGKGQYTNPDGTIYNGYFFAGNKHGEGLFMLPNGDKYEGFFINDKFEGEGIYTFANGDFKKGKWKAGEFVEAVDKLEHVNRFDDFVKIEHREYNQDFDEKNHN